VVQRTSRAAVRVDDDVVGSIRTGLVVFLGVGPDDDDGVAQHLAARVATLRVFADAAGRMNLDVSQAGGELLVISQFTLYADATRGHRPSFLGAADPEQAARLCDVFLDALRGRGLLVGTGRFGAHMEVEVVNDGPVTIVLSSGEAGWDSDAG
jgi:D-tyrosyl-tRNA(Tyr) deacylase